MINFKDLNQRQKKAFKNIKYAAYDYIGGLENTLQDYDKDSEEYKDAYSTLHDHEGLVEIIYNEATTSVYEEGCVWFGKKAESIIKDIRFCGKEFLMQLVEDRVTREGY